MLCSKLPLAASSIFTKRFTFHCSIWRSSASVMAGFHETTSTKSVGVWWFQPTMQFHDFYVNIIEKSKKYINSHTHSLKTTSNLYVNFSVAIAYYMHLQKILSNQLSVQTFGRYKRQLKDVDTEGRIWHLCITNKHIHLFLLDDPKVCTKKWYTKWIIPTKQPYYIMHILYAYHWVTILMAFHQDDDIALWCSLLKL